MVAQICVCCSVILSDRSARATTFQCLNPSGRSVATSEYAGYAAAMSGHATVDDADADAGARLDAVVKAATDE